MLDFSNFFGFLLFLSFIASFTYSLLYKTLFILNRLFSFYYIF